MKDKKSELGAHYHVRDKTAGAIGEAATREVVAEITLDIQTPHTKELGGNPSA